jgi:hypothetical protein
VATVPDLAEIAATVARMEARYRTGSAAGTLMTAYDRLAARFAADLADPRDLALAKSAALMMVAELTATA